MLDDLLTPLNLHRRLDRELTSGIVERPVLRVTQLVPNTIRSFGERLQTAFAQSGRRLGIESATFQSRGLNDLDEVVSRAEDGDADCFLLVQVQGRGGEARLLEPVLQKNLKGRLILYIHRPEELILRIASERDVNYSDAKDVLAPMLKRADAVILPGACFLDEYRQMAPDVLIVAIPLGFAPPKQTVSLSSRLAPGSVTVIGSNTTWGEMRDIRDVLKLMEVVRRIDPAGKTFGYVQGDCDTHGDLGQYVGDDHIRFVSNSEILAGHSAGTFTNEEQFRNWLLNRSDGRLIIRGRVENGKPIPESIPETRAEIRDWESRLIDFDVQMYREILGDRREPMRRGFPKVEYSGTLHKGGAHVIFVVFRSEAMDDVRRDEGQIMVEVPVSDGQPDFDAAAVGIVNLIKQPDERRCVLDHNRVSAESLRMDEVVFAFYLLMDHLQKQRTV